MDVDAAFLAWRRVLGEETVDRGGAATGRLARTTLPSACRPLGVLRPRTRDEVVAVVGIAAEHGVPLYPVSRGCNWGLGSACPVTEGQVVLDLGGLDRIVEVSSELAYAVVEPGVTQGVLARHLDELGLPLVLDCTAAGPDTSVVGNCLERGDGFGPLADHFANCCALEVVLADGTVLETGAAGQPGARTAYTHRQGVGPGLAGLFAQSNLGIVTRMAVWLQPLPEQVLGFSITVADEASFGELLERLRPLRLDGTLSQAVHVFNAARFVDGAEAAPSAAAPHGEVAPAWTALGGLYGTRAQVRAHREALEHAVDGVAACRFFDVEQLRRGLAEARARAERGDPAGEERHRALRADLAFLGLLAGVPGSHGLEQVRRQARRAAHPSSLDPRDSGVGMVWLALQCPLRGADACGLSRLVTTVFCEHGFEAPLTCTLTSGRAALMTATLFFDRDDAGERERAARCHDAVLARAAAAGYPPSRVGVGGMHALDRDRTPFWRVARRLKESLDPGGIIAPGRYAPWEAPPPAPGAPARRDAAEPGRADRGRTIGFLRVDEDTVISHRIYDHDLFVQLATAFDTVRIERWRAPSELPRWLGELERRGVDYLFVFVFSEAYLPVVELLEARNAARSALRFILLPCILVPELERLYRDMPRHLHQQDVVVLLSRHVRRSLLRLSPRYDDFLTPCWTDPDAFPANSRPPSDTLAVLFCARLVPGKGLAELIEALGLLRASHRFALHVVTDERPGHAPDGYVARVQSRLDALDLRGRTTFHGSLIDEQHRRMELMAACDVLVHPTTYEGETFGRIVIEAFAAGLAVITTDWQGVNEQVGPDNGYLLATHETGGGRRVDPVELAAALRRLYQPGVLARFRRHNRERARAFDYRVEARRLREHVERKLRADG